MTSPVDIRPDHLEIVQGILREHLPMGVKVWVFGSRANWSTKDSSDLDLALESESKLSHKLLGQLKDSFEVSMLPYTVDVVDLRRIGDSFRQIVKSQRVPLPAEEAATIGASLTGSNGQWRTVKLGDVCTKIGSGATPRGGKGVYLQDGPYALIRSQNVYNDGFHGEGLAFIGEHHAVELRNVEVSEGDVLLNITGDSVARVCQVVPDVLPARVNQHVAIIRPDSHNLGAGYLRYYLVSPEMQTLLLSWAGSGGTRNALTKGMIESLEIPLPPFPEQHAIAHILGTLDDKIELNRRMNETLEAMARAMFKSWFVDFEPVRAKTEGRWHRGESLYGFPADVYDLFPDRLVDSELGEIPEGWEVKALGECFSLTMGQSPPGNTYNDNGQGLPFFQGSTDFGERYPTNRRYCTEPARLAQMEDTLVSVRAPVGAINRAWERCCIGRGVAALRHNSGSAPYTYYAIWVAQPGISQYEHTGTVFGAIGRKQFRALQVLEPPRETIAAFDRVGQDLDGRIRSNVDASRSLATQRDALLPRLVSGQLKLESV